MILAAALAFMAVSSATTQARAEVTRLATPDLPCHGADPAHIFAAGTSRGGFLAFHVAAAASHGQAAAWFAARFPDQSVRQHE